MGVILQETNISHLSKGNFSEHHLLKQKCKSAGNLVWDMGSFCFGGYPKVVGTPQLCRVDHAGVSNLKDDTDTPYNLKR